jgi:energy-coupling factor transport system ATP-binding protein
LPFSDGDIQYNGKTLKRRKRNKLSYMIMQDVNHQLFSDCVWNECKSLSKEVDCEEISTILKAFSLDNWKQHHPMALSGGQKQRLAIATGILSRKRILLFDEPTSGLDYENMIAVSGMIKKLSNQDFMIIIVSHDKEFLSCTCNRQVKI